MMKAVEAENVFMAVECFLWMSAISENSHSTYVTLVNIKAETAEQYYFCTLSLFLSVVSFNEFIDLLK